MKNDDIKTLAEALQHSKDEKESMTKINKVFRNKSCASLVAEFKHLMPEMQGKEISKALLVLVLAILHKKRQCFGAASKSIGFRRTNP